MRLSAHALEHEGPSFQLLHISETVKTPISTVIEYQWTVRALPRVVKVGTRRLGTRLVQSMVLS
jgi:hypothetical protein